MVTAALGLCALCATAATVTDWEPIQAWVAVEGCLCGGFFIWKTLWDGRLPGMAQAECQELTTRIREWRARGFEVWISTTDRTVHGALYLSSARPLRALREHPRS
jgi:hypothetical protein